MRASHNGARPLGAGEHVPTETLLALADLAAAFAILGLAAALAGAAATLVFVRRAAPAAPARPPVTVLKPLCGNEPLLDEALGTFCQQDYPVFQLVLGVQDPGDPALAAVERIRRRWPDVDITVIADPALHGPNRKVSNLINMLPAARHDMLVFADSDLHVPRDYLSRLAGALGQPGVGLVTTVSTGRPAGASLASALGCMHISHYFLPSVMLSRWLGRQDCLGTTMALHRRTLGLAGGLAALLPHLADDHVLGRRVRALGLSVTLAPVITATTVQETRFTALWAHELRWARTVAGLEPLLGRLVPLHHALFWAAQALVLSGGAPGMIRLFALVWAARAAALLAVAHATGQTARAGGWRQACAAAGLLPLRDLLSAAVAVASFGGDRVLWRGHMMRADNGVWPGNGGDRFTSTPAPVSVMVALTEEGPS